MSESVAQRAPGRSAERRTALLDAADRVIRRDGPDVSMSAVAAEAGVTKPIVYRHFGDKAGLYRALAERHLDDLLVRLRTALARTDDRRARVAAAIDAYLRLIEEEPEIYRFLVHHAAVEEPSVQGFVATFVSRLAAEFADGIRRELALPRGRSAAADAWAHGLVGMVQAAGDWWLAERSAGRRISRRVVVGHLVDLVSGAYVAGG